jgi:hypothetical protein
MSGGTLQLCERPVGFLFYGNTPGLLEPRMCNLVWRWLLSIPTPCVRNLVCELATENLVMMRKFGFGSYS